MNGPRPDLGMQHEGGSLVVALRVLRERWPVVLAALVVCTGVAVALSLSGTKQYSATSSLLLRESQLTGLIDPSGGGTKDPQRDQSTNLLLVQSTTVANRVKKALRLPDPAGSLLGQISAQAEPDADLLNITATDPDPRRSAALANGFADQFVSYRREVERARIAEGERLLRQQIAQLPPEATAQRSELQAALNRVTALRAVTTGNAEVVDRAGVPGAPSSPRPKRDAALGLVLGLVAGLALAFLVDLFDRRVKSVEDFEARYGLRALSAVVERDRVPASLRDRQAALEPFRILRGALSFLSTSSDIRVVMVTSAVPGEGKSTVAAGLARAVALSGERVVLIEADLRRPTFHEQFDLGGDDRGLTTALVAGVPARDLLRPGVSGLPTLSVLPSGPLPSNSAELLRSAEMSDVLRELADEVDMVILDAPPLLPVADSQVLLDHPAVDAALVVGRAFRTTRDDVRRCRAVLERHRLRNIGLVINGLRDREVGYEYYGHDTAADTERVSTKS
jgi:capsular exopolysaccharide synthesis family protein